MRGLGGEMAAGGEAPLSLRKWGRGDDEIGRRFSGGGGVRAPVRFSSSRAREGGARRG
jgi:hypothetical protein